MSLGGRQAIGRESTPIIGLTGGIGAGKSTVAGCLEGLGCVVIDSDARAKALLDEPSVRETLVRWWGDRVLDRAGRIDREALAGLVFADPAERGRLERLIHPLLADRREETIRRAAAADAPGVVLDAPLLIEAGLDRECDAVIYVDAPAVDRLQRVLTARGWTADELDRRQTAQSPLEIKRQRAHYVVSNTGSVDDLCHQARRVFEQIQKDISPEWPGKHPG